MPDAHRRAAQWRFRCNARNQRPSALVCSVMVPVHLFSAYSRPSSVGSTSGRRQLTITSTTVLTIIPRARSAVLPMLVTMSSSCPCRMSGPSALTLYTTFRCAGYTCSVAHPSLTTCSTVRMSILASGASRRILYRLGRNRCSSRSGPVHSMMRGNHGSATGFNTEHRDAATDGRAVDAGRPRPAGQAVVS